MMDELISKRAALLAMVEKGQESKRTAWGESWELNLAEIQDALKTVPAVDAIPVEWVEDLIRRLRGETAAASRATSTHLEKMLRIWREEGCHTMPH